MRFTCTSKNALVIGLILIDIDGTLVGPGNIIPASAWDAIADAQRRGRHVALCTGRPCSGHAAEYAAAVAPNDPHIFHSGAVVCDPDGTIRHIELLPPASYERQVLLARANGQSLEAYTATQCYVEKPSIWTTKHAEIISLDTEVTDDLLGLRDPIVRVQWVMPWADWPTYEQATLADPDLELSVATQPDLPEACFSSVTARGVSKASAARWLSEHYGLKMTQVAMIGDGDNDLEAFAAVGLPIAMGNGTPKAKAAALQVVGTVDNDGLAEAITIALRTP